MAVLLTLRKDRYWRL